MIGTVEHIESDGKVVNHVRIRVEVLSTSRARSVGSAPREGLGKRQSPSSASTSAFRTLDIFTQECIGQGSFGTVYRAVADGYSNIALKIMTGKPSRLQEELNVLRRVCTKGHLSLPRFEFGALNANKDLLIVGMELCIPSTLHDLLLSTRLTNEADMLFLGYEVVLAISCLHSEGCIHRDIKLQNFVFDVEGNLKLIDYGLASTSAHPPPGDIVAGTVSFMSPEMAYNVLHREKRVSVGMEADMWSLGIVLFSIFTQRNPYSSSPTAEGARDEHEGNGLERGTGDSQNGRAGREEEESHGSGNTSTTTASNENSTVEEKRHVELLHRVAAANWCWPEGCYVSPAARSLIESLLVKTPADRATIGQVLQHHIWTARRRCPPAAVTAFLGVEDHFLMSNEETCLLNAVTTMLTERQHMGRSGSPSSCQHASHPSERYDVSPPHSLPSSPCGKDGGGGSFSGLLHDTGRREASCEGKAAAPHSPHGGEEEEQRLPPPLQGRTSLKVVAKEQVELDGYHHVTNIYDIRSGGRRGRKGTREEKAEEDGAGTTWDTSGDLNAASTAGLRQRRRTREKSHSIKEITEVIREASTSMTRPPERRGHGVVCTSSGTSAATVAAALVPKGKSRSRSHPNALPPVTQLTTGAKEEEGTWEKRRTAGSSFSFLRSMRSAVKREDEEAISKESKSTVSAGDPLLAPLGFSTMEENGCPPCTEEEAAVEHDIKASGRKGRGTARRNSSRSPCRGRRGTTHPMEKEEERTVDAAHRSDLHRERRGDATERLAITGDRRNVAPRNALAPGEGSAEEIITTSSSVSLPLCSFHVEAALGKKQTETMVSTVGVEVSYERVETLINAVADPSRAMMLVKEERSEPSFVSSSRHHGGPSPPPLTAPLSVAFMRDEQGERKWVSSLLWLQHAQLLKYVRTITVEDQEREHLRWLEAAQRTSAAHPHVFQPITRAATGAYRYGYVCDSCDYDFLPASKGAKMFYFHCDCGRDMCEDCFHLHEKKYTCPQCRTVCPNGSALRDHAKTPCTSASKAATRLPHSGVLLSVTSTREPRSVEKGRRADLPSSSAPSTTSSTPTTGRVARHRLDSATPGKKRPLGERAVSTAKAKENPAAPPLPGGGTRTTSTALTISEVKSTVGSGRTSKKNLLPSPTLASKRKALTKEHPTPEEEEEQAVSAIHIPRKGSTASSGMSPITAHTAKMSCRLLPSRPSASPASLSSSRSDHQNASSLPSSKRSRSTTGISEEESHTEENRSRLKVQEARSSCLKRLKRQPQDVLRRRKSEETGGAEGKSDEEGVAAEGSRERKRTSLLLEHTEWKPFAKLRAAQEQTKPAPILPTEEEREAFLHGPWVQSFYLYPPNGEEDTLDAFAYHIQHGRTGAIFLTPNVEAHSAVFSVLEHALHVVQEVNIEAQQDSAYTYPLLHAMGNSLLEPVFLLMQDIVSFESNLRKQHRTPGTVSVHPSPRAHLPHSSANGEPFVYVRWFRRNAEGSIWIFLLSHGGLQAYVNNEYELRWIENEEGRVFRIRSSGVCDIISRDFPVFSIIEALLYDP